MNQIRIVLLVGASLLLSVFAGGAQEIKLSTVAAKGSPISFNLAAAQEGTKASIDWGDGVFEEYVIGPTFSEPSGMVKGTNIVIKGDVRRFNCTSSKLTMLDVSKCPQLEVLMAALNYLSEIDLSRNTELANIELFSNSLKSLDVKACSKLQRLVVSGNFLSELDVTHCPELTYFDCARMGRLERLDLALCSKLTHLIASECSLTGLVLSEKAPLEELLIADNSLSELNLAPYNKLKTLNCSGNKEIEELILNAPELTQLLAMNTAISQLDLTHCPKLSYLMVTGASKLSKLLLPSPCLLTDLGMSSCNFDQIDFGTMSLLSQLWCNSNTRLTHLDVSKCPELTRLEAKKCALEKLKLHPLPSKLAFLQVPYNKLTALSLKGMAQLETLDLGSNQLSEIDLSECPQLKLLNLRNNQIHALDLSRTSKLTMLGIPENKMTSQELNAIYRQLPMLDEKPTKINLINGLRGDFSAQCSNTDIAEGLNWTPQIKGDGSGADLDALLEPEGAKFVRFVVSDGQLAIQGQALQGVVQLYAFDGSLLYTVRVEGSSVVLSRPAQGTYLAVYTDAVSGHRHLEKLYF